MYCVLSVPFVRFTFIGIIMYNINKLYIIFNQDEKQDVLIHHIVFRAVCKQFGPNTGRLTLCFLLFSSGMFISCAAFLPSSFAMYLTMTAMAGWWLNQVPVAIFSVALSALLGWPFAGALG